MEITRVLKSKSFYYSLAVFLTKASVFIIIPVSAIFLNIKDFSAFGIIFPTITLMTITSSFGLGSFLLKKIPDLGINKKDEIISIGISLWFIVNLIFFIVITLISYFYFREYFILIILTAGCCIFNSSIILNISKHQLLDSNFKYVFFSSGVKIFYALEILFFIKIQDVDLHKILFTFFFTSLIFFLISLYDNIKNIKYEWINPFKSEYRIIQFCFPLLLNSFVAYLLFINSKIILDYYNFIEYSSIYSMSYTFSAILSLLFAIFISLYAPKIFTEESRVIKKINSIVESLSYLTLFLSILILIIYKFYTQSILDSEEFKNTSYYTSIFLASQFIYIYYITKVDFLILKNKTKLIMYINIILAFVSLLINYLSIELFGPKAIFYTLIITQLFLAFLVTFYVRIKNSFKTLSLTFLFIILIISVSLIDSYILYLFSFILLTFKLFYKKELLIKNLNFLNEKNTIH